MSVWQSKFDVGCITREDLVYAHPLHQRYENDIRNFVDKLDDATLQRIADKMTEELSNNGAISEALAMVVNKLDIFEECNLWR